MSRLYNITVLGKDEPGTWLAAAAFAALDLRIALCLESAPDPDLEPFPELPFPAHRQAGMMAAAGLKPGGSPFPAWRPEFQVITSEGVLDLLSDPGEWERALTREYQGMTRSFLDRVGELEALATEVAASARAKGFPYRGMNNGGLLKRLLPGGQGWAAPATPPFSQWSLGLTRGQSRAILAVAAAALGAEINPDGPLLPIALLWSASRDFHHGPGPDTELRQQALAALSKRGVVMEASPEAVITQGKMVKSVRLRGGSVLDTQVLIAGKKALASLPGRPITFGADDGSAPEFIHATMFFKLERPAIPEALAERAIVIRDLDRPLTGDNLMVITRHRRVPARETIAVTVFSPPAELEPEHVPGLLGEALPWLEPGLMSVDDTRPPQVERRPQPPADLAGIAWPKTPWENLFPLPADLAPGWGPAGLPVAVAGLRDSVSDLLKKYKTRKW